MMKDMAYEGCKDMSCILLRGEDAKAFRAHLQKKPVKNLKAIKLLNHGRALRSEGTGDYKIGAGSGD